MKFFIAIAFLGIIGALVTAGVFMLRGGRDGQSKSGKMMRVLALRVGLSVLLFVCILISYWAGWIKPSGIPLGQ